MKLNQATEIAEQIVRKLAPYCERIEIAGSIRRGNPEVKDIEIVAQPKYNWDEDLFGNLYKSPTLDRFDFCSLGSIVKGGEKMKKIDLGEINLDLFVVTPPAQWGVIYLIRTGPREFSRWMVTQRKKGGALPSNSRVKDGVIINNGLEVITPDEIDFFGYCQLSFMQPRDRKPLW